MLIFDEVVTFPIAYGGAQAHHGVTPDLTTMSKAIGGGLPLAAIGGRAEIMDLLDPELHGGGAPVASVSTFGGNQAALAAGIACLEQLTPEVHARVQAIGDRARAAASTSSAQTYGIPLHATVSATSSACTGRRSASSTTARGCRTTARRSPTSSWR